MRYRSRGLRGPTVVSLPDLIEALVRLGRPADAAIRVAEFERRVADVPDPRAPALVARCRALVGTGADADMAFRQALSHHQGDPDSFVIARTQLLYGEWLRRQRRRREARVQLRTALEMFEAMGLRCFAERAGVELGATGEHVQKREIGTLEGLTPQEAQIAALAGRGQANREIAAQLFVSPNTVEYHLRKVFRKLGVSSRTQLAHRVTDQGIGTLHPVPVAEHPVLDGHR